MKRVASSFLSRGTPKKMLRLKKASLLTTRVSVLRLLRYTTVPILKAERVSFFLERSSETAGNSILGILWPLVRPRSPSGTWSICTLLPWPGFGVVSGLERSGPWRIPTGSLSIFTIYRENTNVYLGSLARFSVGPPRLHCLIGLL